jgi:hypothetical protein
MDFLDLAPRGMVGWQEELDDAPALLLGGPGEMRCRLFVTAKGITLMVAAKDLAAARELLVRSGFPEDRVRVLLCG